MVRGDGTIEPVQKVTFRLMYEALGAGQILCLDSYGVTRELIKDEVMQDAYVCEGMERETVVGLFVEDHGGEMVQVASLVEQSELKAKVKSVLDQVEAYAGPFVLAEGQHEDLTFGWQTLVRIIDTSSIPLQLGTINAACSF